MTDDHPWLTEGARVAVLSTGAMRGQRVSFATVTKIGKRDVVLDNDRRYSVRTLRPSGNYYGDTELRDVADPRVIQAHTMQVQEKAVSVVESLLREWRNALPHQRTLEPLEHAQRVLAKILA